MRGEEGRAKDENQLRRLRRLVRNPEKLWETKGRRTTKKKRVLRQSRKKTWRRKKKIQDQTLSIIGCSYQNKSREVRKRENNENNQNKSYQWREQLRCCCRWFDRRHLIFPHFRQRFKQRWKGQRKKESRSNWETIKYQQRRMVQHQQNPPRKTWSHQNYSVNHVKMPTGWLTARHPSKNQCFLSSPTA